MKIKQANIALQYLNYLLHSISFTEAPSYSKIAKGNYYSTPVNDGAKFVTIAFDSPAIADEAINSLQEFGLEASKIEERPHPKQKGKITIALRQIYLMHENAKKTNDVATGKGTSSALVVREQEIVENIFREHKLLFSSDYNLDSHELQVSFNVGYYCEKAARILSDYKVAFVDDGKDMYISLALPDAMLNGILKSESQEEKSSRHLVEFAQHLNFALKHKLNLKVLSPHGGTIPKVGSMYISGSNRSLKRLAFSDIKTKKDVIKLLDSMGFNCEEPKSKEANVIMVDLLKTKTIAEIATDVSSNEANLVVEAEEVKGNQEEGVLPSVTIPELKACLKENKTPVKSIVLIHPNEEKLIFEKQQVFYFDTKLVAEKAHGFLVNHFPKNIHIGYEDGKSVKIPDRIFKKTPMDKKNKVSRETVVEEMAKPKDTALVISAVEQALIDLRKSIKEEIQQDYFLIDKKLVVLKVPESVVKQYTSEGLTISVEELVKYL